MNDEFRLAFISNTDQNVDSQRLNSEKTPLSKKMDPKSIFTKVRFITKHYVNFIKI